MSSANQVRIVIEQFCTILQQNNICFVRAEMLRQAKYNKDDSAPFLWKLLYDVICFCKSKPGNTDKSTQQVSSGNISELEVLFVKSELQKWGYLSHTFATLPHDISTGSRELLLALGWVIQKQKVFEKISTSRPNPLHQQLMKFLGHQERDSTLSSDTETPFLSVGTNLAQNDIIQQQLMLCNKLNFSCRRLYSARQEVQCLTNKIHQFTTGVSLQTELNHLTSLEVYLLRHPESLKKMLSELEKDNLALQNLLTWKEQEPVFWEWMNSVLNLHVDEKKAKSAVKFSQEDVYLPLPTNIGKEIADARAELRDFILKHESEIERLDQLILDKRLTPGELHVLSSQGDVEMAKLSRTLSCCGIGWDTTRDSGHEDNSVMTTIGKEDLSTCSPALVSAAPVRKSKFIPQSEKNIKAAKIEILHQEVKNETRLLEQQIQKLESELKHIQLNNLKILQTHIDSDPSIICIQPRYLKQLLQDFT